MQGGICNDTNTNFVQTDAGWAFFYYFFFAITFVLLIIYLILILPEVRTTRPKLRGFLLAVWWFFGQLAFRSLGSLGCGIILSLPKPKQRQSFAIAQPFLYGLPGYITAISYCFLFALWSSIATNLICNDASGSYEVRRKQINIILFVIVIAAIVSLILNVRFPNKDYPHIVEVCFAIIRDLSCSLFFLYHLRKLRIMLYKKLNKSLCQAHNTESSLLLLGYTISIALIWRVVSIIIFATTYMDKHDSLNPKGCSSYAYGINFFHQIVTEFLPMAIIVFSHKKSAILTVYDPF